MQIKKIPVLKVSDSVAEQIEEMIHSGTFLAGDKLPSVRELCELFGVGRSAVRDAITTLKGKGIVDVKRGEGTFILEFDSTRLFNNHLLLTSPKDISELFQVRKILEPGIAEMAAIHRSEADLNVMEEIFSNQSIKGWESDYLLHKAIAEAAGNEIIKQLLQFISTTMKNAMIDFHHYIEKNPATAKMMENQHLVIFESIKHGKPQQAKQMMMEHLDFVEKELLKSHVIQQTVGR
ncbi:FadR/GntR family transcriptional regulator [Neobacillus bataviensis]|uniref:FadR/GntR family transcriptional regulator n=1 Tax=Neobacillus bataviensis TaxID=220685 RepID=UPI001CBB800A|nr:FadR/GntR family transcriptional regulator [Neobacillus bataviensis]